MYHMEIIQTNFRNYYTIYRNDKIIYDESNEIDFNKEDIICVFREDELDEYAMKIISLKKEKD